MKKLFTKSDVNGVKQSLIASILFLLILEPLVHIAKNVASRGIMALVDYFYYSCGRVDNVHFISYLVFVVFMMEALNPVISMVKRSRCRSSQEVNDAPTLFSASICVYEFCVA